MSTIYFAGGCFWGVQKFFDQFDGVIATEVGYANGREEETTYERVGATDHAETVKVEFDADRITLAELIDFYFQAIDPLAINRQGPDIGRQYRTGIYYTEEAQKPLIEEKCEALSSRLGEPIAVEVEPLYHYCTAEDGHQKYLDRRPGGYCHLSPYLFRLAKAKREE